MLNDSDARQMTDAHYRKISSNTRSQLSWKSRLYKYTNPKISIIVSKPVVSPVITWFPFTTMWPRPCDSFSVNRCFPLIEYKCNENLSWNKEFKMLFTPKRKLWSLWLTFTAEFQNIAMWKLHCNIY